MNRPATHSHHAPPAGDAVTIPGNRDSLWRFAALGVLLVLPAPFLLGDGDVTVDDLVIVSIALLPSAIIWFGVALLLTMRVVITPETLTFHGLTFQNRTIARTDLDRIAAERRATLGRGVFWPSPQLHVTLSGRDRGGEPVELRLSGMMLDTERLLAALAPWVEARPTLVRDDATREAIASLGMTPAAAIARTSR